MYYLFISTCIKQKLLIFNIFILLLNLIFFQHSLADKNNKYNLTKLVIDAGHGGKDPGTRGKKCNEKDITLSIALKLGNYINANLPDVEVIYTRQTDVFVPLDERSKIANKNNADIFISIHANSSPDEKIYGTETFAMGLHKSENNLEVAKLENSAILYEENYETKYEGYDPNSAESFIIFSLLQNSFLEQSIDFASYVQHQFKNRVNRYDRGVKQAGFVVLWRTTMPSVLIEVGFLSNSNEEKFLISEKGQDYIASAIFRAFRDYKNKIENTSGEITSQENASSKLAPHNLADSSNKVPITTTIDAEVKLTDTIVAKNDNLILFKIQIASSKNQISLTSDFFKGLKNIDENLINDIYKYVIGNKTSYNEIIEYRKEIIKFFPDAFIVAFKNGELIPLNQALKEINN